ATLKDDAWIKDIYKDVEKQSTDNSDLVKLAAVAAEKLNDRDWAKDLLARAEAQSDTLNEYTLVAGAYLRLLDDREKAIALYEAAEAQCTDKVSYARLISLVHGQSADNSFVTRIVISARKKLTGFDDLLFLAETARILLADTGLASQIFSQAEATATDTRKLSRLATSLKDRMKDSAWASRVLRKIA
ncbi:MAG TPA: hypothetical protein VK885_11945, partial [Desulfotignum sp.]|nr:hypothetical protein [Desulfotignum sp.]